MIDKNLTFTEWMDFRAETIVSYPYEVEHTSSESSIRTYESQEAAEIDAFATFYHRSRNGLSVNMDAYGKGCSVFWMVGNDEYAKMVNISFTWPQQPNCGK
jgi:hypothetical protein